MSGLTKQQLDNNANWILTLLAIYNKNLLTEAQIENIKSQVNQFLFDHAILLSKLNSAQELAFNQLIDSLFSQVIANDAIEKKMLAWTQAEQVSSLPLITSGFAQTLLETGNISFSQWGSDLDISQALKQQTSQFAFITREQLLANGARHIMMPVSLTDAVGEAPDFELFQKSIEEAQATVSALDVSETVEVSIPVNSNDDHWRVVKVTLSNKELSKVDLWDSFGPQANIKNTLAYLNMKAAIAKVQPNIEPSLSFAGIQKNSSSCADFTIQKCLQNKFAVLTTDSKTVVLNKLAPDATDFAPILLAGQDSKVLRVNIVKQIAQHHRALGPVVAASIDTNAQHNHVILGTQAIENSFADLGVNQVTFDALMAERLQKLYQDDECAKPLTTRCTRATKQTEDLLVSKAYAQAYAFFKKQPVPTLEHDEGVTLDLNKSKIDCYTKPLKV